MLCMHMVHVNENLSFFARDLFDMQLPDLTEKSCMFILCNTCGNARGLLVVFGLVSLFLR